MQLSSIFGVAELKGCARNLHMPVLKRQASSSRSTQSPDSFRSAVRKFVVFGVFLGWLMPVMAFAGVDLVLNNADSPDPVPAGGVVTYTMRISNNGDTAATGVSSVHAVPADTEYLGFTGAGVNCAGMAPNAPGPGVVTCTHPTLASLEDGVNFTIQLRTTAQGSIIFGATTSSTEPDDEATNNTADETTTVGTGANVSISKTPANGNVPAGSVFSWTLSASNTGPDAATHLRVEDPVPTGFTVTTLPAGCSNVANVIRCDIAGPIASGATHQIGDVTGVIHAASASTVTNVATVALQPTAPITAPRDPDTSHNTAVSNITVDAGSDLRITKSRSVSGNFLVGDSFDFILAPRYNGDVPNTITVTDNIPANYTIGAVASPQNG